MTNYVCFASDKKGKIRKSVRQAESVEALQATLYEEGYFPISIHEHEDKRSGKFSRVPRKTINDFTTLMSLLLESGLGVKDALEIIKTLNQDRKLIAFAAGIEKDLNSGYSFHGSIKSYADTIPPVYTSLVKVGETTGDLAAVFRKLTSYLARQKKMREKLLGSLIYPVIVLTVALFSIIVIIAYIVPSMTEIFMEIGSGLPPEVSRVLTLLRFIFYFLLTGIPMVLFISAGLSLLRRRSEAIALGIDRIKLMVPVVGSFSKDSHFLNILFTLDSLTSSGITVEDSLREAAATSTNTVIRGAFVRVHQKVLKGIDVSKAMSDEEIIPERITKWLVVGERSGSMGRVFSQLSEYYENELEKKITRFMSLIEPALIIFTGAIVFAIVLFIIIPLFSSFGMVLG